MPKNSTAPPWESFPKNATEPQITKAYRRWVKKVHPDAGGSKVDCQKLEAWKRAALADLNARNRRPEKREAPPQPSPPTRHSPEQATQQSPQQQSTPQPPPPRRPKPFKPRHPQQQSSQPPPAAPHTHSPAGRHIVRTVGKTWILLVCLAAIGGVGLAGVFCIGLMLILLANPEPSARPLPQNIEVVIAFPQDEANRGGNHPAPLKNSGLEPESIEMPPSLPATPPDAESGSSSVTGEPPVEPEVPATTPATRPSRQWNDKTNTFSVYAALLRSDGRNVALLKENGVTIIVPVETLSESDRRYLSGITDTFQEKLPPTDSPAEPTTKLLFLVGAQNFTTKNAADLQKLVHTRLERINVSPKAWNVEAGLSHYAYVLDVTREEREAIIKRFGETGLHEFKESVETSLSAVGLRVYPRQLPPKRRPK